ncbi:unnamed protein product [Arctogadus glacialis]
MLWTNETRRMGRISSDEQVKHRAPLGYVRPPPPSNTLPPAPSGADTGMQKKGKANLSALHAEGATLPGTRSSTAQRGRPRSSEPSTWRGAAQIAPCPGWHRASARCATSGCVTSAPTCTNTTGRSPPPSTQTWTYTSHLRPPAPTVLTGRTREGPAPWPCPQQNQASTTRAHRGGASITPRLFSCSFPPGRLPYI